MAVPIDPRIQRFLAKHAVSVVQEVLADVAEARGATPAERWQALLRLSKSLAWIRSQPEEQQARVLEWRDLPAPSYHQLIARLRRNGPGR